MDFTPPRSVLILFAGPLSAVSARLPNCWAVCLEAGQIDVALQQRPPKSRLNGSIFGFLGGLQILHCPTGKAKGDNSETAALSAVPTLKLRGLIR
jgi:hypothetical protein